MQSANEGLHSRVRVHQMQIKSVHSHAKTRDMLGHLHTDYRPAQTYGLAHARAHTQTYTYTCGGGRGWIPQLPRPTSAHHTRAPLHLPAGSRLPHQLLCCDAAPKLPPGSWLKLMNQQVPAAVLQMSHQIRDSASPYPSVKHTLIRKLPSLLITLPVPEPNIAPYQSHASLYCLTFSHCAFPFLTRARTQMSPSTWAPITTRTCLHARACTHTRTHRRAPAQHLPQWLGCPAVCWCLPPAHACPDGAQPPPEPPTAAWCACIQAIGLHLLLHNHKSK